MQASHSLYWVDKSINQTSPDIIVINRGAHVRPDQESKNQMIHTTNSLLSWQRRCKDKSEDCHLIWRTTVPGHPRCWEFTKPSKSIEEMEELVASATKSSSRNDSMVVSWGAFNWASFKRQNEMFISLLEHSVPGLEFDVMPAYEISILRPDDHVLLPPNKTADKIDCLHSRYPGKIGVYNRLLLHVILMRQEHQAFSGNTFCFQ